MNHHWVKQDSTEQHWTQCRHNLLFTSSTTAPKKKEKKQLLKHRWPIQAHINRPTSRQYIWHCIELKTRSRPALGCTELTSPRSDPSYQHPHTHLRLRSAKVHHCQQDSETSSLSREWLSWPGLVLDPLQRHYSRECTADNLGAGAQRRF